MGSPAERLERFYKLFPWVEDPFAPGGRARYETALKFFRQLLEHEWLKELLPRGELSLLDICGGTGVGGVALAKALAEQGVKVRMTVCDLRESALRVAERFSAAELGSPARTIKADARELHALGEEFDAALLYGLSTPHFDAFAMVELLASASESLADDSLLLVEEGDRFYNMAILGRYRDVVYEGDEERGVLSMGAGYDALRGVVKRLYINPFTGERVALELRYWDLAGTLALAWLFFEDVDFVGYAGRAYTGMILARSPRKRLRPGDLKRPRCLAQLPRGV
jgi:uncharacterized UPF0146 family protein